MSTNHFIIDRTETEKDGKNQCQITNLNIPSLSEASLMSK